MSFLGVKVILFLVIPLIIKEKSNASALRSMRHDFINAFARLSQGFYLIIRFVLRFGFIVYSFLYQSFNDIRVMLFLYFVPSLNLSFRIRNILEPNCYVIEARQKYKRKQHNKQRYNNIINNDTTTSTTLHDSILSL